MISWRGSFSSLVREPFGGGACLPFPLVFLVVVDAVERGADPKIDLLDGPARVVRVDCPAFSFSSPLEFSFATREEFCLVLAESRWETLRVRGMVDVGEHNDERCENG